MSDANDTAHSDMSGSRDVFMALQEFYKKFPEYAENELFISGESYAGLYVPYLAWQIHQSNLKFDIYNGTAPGPTMRYNLIGTLVGNGATDWLVDNAPSIPPTITKFGLVPQPWLDQFEQDGCKYYFSDSLYPHEGGPECDDLYDKIMGMIQDLNIYDMFRTNLIDVSDEGERVFKSVEDRMRTVNINGHEKTYKRGFTSNEYLWWSNSPLKSDNDLTGEFLSDWMNLNETRAALHIGDEAPGWSECNGDVYTEYKLTKEGSFWIYPVLKAAGIRMMFYSGETDGALPTYATKEWIANLNYDVVEEWKPWMYGDNQVAGWWERYDGLDFVIVRGVGHMAPQWAPEAVLNMVNNWIANKPIG